MKSICRVGQGLFFYSPSGRGYGVHPEVSEVELHMQLFQEIERERDDCLNPEIHRVLGTSPIRGLFQLKSEN